MTNPTTDRKQTMSLQELALLGGGDVAYVRKISGDEATEIRAQVPDLPSDIQLYALHAADGSCMTITDSRNAAMADAWDHDLSPVSVH